MVTIKSFTSLEQSRKLAEILPLESADMVYMPIMDIDSMSNSGFFDVPECYPLIEFKGSSIKPLACWSLAALLGVLTDCPDLSKHTDNKWYITTYPNGVHTCLMAFDNPVDACVAMIEKLNELNLL